MSGLITLTQKDLSPIEARFVQLTDQKTFEREASFALQHIAKNPELQKCTRDSLISAVMNIANFGLSLNPVKKEAHLVPRWDWKSKSSICHLEPSYQGLIKAVTEVGGIRAVTAYPVYKDDFFEVSLGTSMKVDHKPAFMSRSKNDIVKFYCIIFLDTGEAIPEIMTRGDVDEIMMKSTSWQAFNKGDIKTCIWNDHYSEMGRKTVIRRAVKYAPKKNADRLQDLVGQDETDWMPSERQIELAENLIDSSIYDEHKKMQLMASLYSLNQADYDNLLVTLQNDQKPVTDQYAPSQKELTQAMDERMDRDE